MKIFVDQLNQPYRQLDADLDSGGYWTTLQDLDPAVAWVLARICLRDVEVQP